METHMTNPVSEMSEVTSCKENENSCSLEDVILLFSEQYVKISPVFLTVVLTSLKASRLSFQNEPRSKSNQHRVDLLMSQT